MHTSGLLNAMSDLFGLDLLLLWSCSFVVKVPRSRGRYPWHQDATYWGMKPPSTVSAWIALDDVDPENRGRTSTVIDPVQRGQVAKGSN